MNEAPLYRRLSLNKHGFLDASAGTGKTYTLENFIARLITESWNQCESDIGNDFH